MSTVMLNLARKWRSTTFDQVVGQDLSVRILKNSLYLNHFFPVYLFSGQRGCGKTTMARIFSKAINCAHLSAFQGDPRSYTIPCLECSSCIMMSNNNHPDFIEIDAASHTGVDNVRTIIEAASFLPLVGIKRVYLIDEAHMLSKAAFNAFLKILEEPPFHTLFILATTDVEKIIETVRSRSFQLFFKAVEQEPLLRYLSSICQQENIQYEDQGLIEVINNTDGSVRDALNLIEQVRFSTNKITKTAVLTLLGHCSEIAIVELMQAIITSDQAAVLGVCKKYDLERYNVSMMWKNIGLLLRALLWQSNGIVSPLYADHAATVAKMLEQVGNNQRLMDLMSIWQEYEGPIAQSTMPYTLFAMMLLTMAHSRVTHGPTDSSPVQSRAPIAVSSVKNQEPEKVLHTVSRETRPDKGEHPQPQQWSLFLEKLGTLEDPLLNSIFKHARFVQYADNHVKISFSQDFSFFNERLDTTQHAWLPLLKAVFGDHAVLIRTFTDDKVKPVAAPLPEIKKIAPKPAQVKAAEPPPASKPYPGQKYGSGSKYQKRSENIEKIIDVSNAQLWEKAHLLLEFFPGIVVEHKEQ